MSRLNLTKHQVILFVTSLFSAFVSFTAFTGIKKGGQDITAGFIIGIAAIACFGIAAYPIIRRPKFNKQLNSAVDNSRPPISTINAENKPFHKQSEMKNNSVKSIISTLLKYVMLPTMALGLLIGAWTKNLLYIFMLIAGGFFGTFILIMKSISKLEKSYPSLSSGLPLMLFSIISIFVGLIIFAGFVTGLLSVIENPNHKDAITKFINEPLSVSCGRFGNGLKYGGIALIVLVCLFLAVTFFAYLFSFAGIPRILLR